MVVSERHRVIYIEPPKTGTTTMRALLSRFEFIGLRRHMLEVPHEYRNYDKIITIRNPYDRFISVWLSATTNDGDRYNFIKMAGGGDFISGAMMLIDLKDNDKKSRPLAWDQSIYHAKNSIDQMLKLERLEEDFNALAFVNEKVTMTIGNKTGTKKEHWTHYYTEGLLEMVNYLYEDDFNLLPYTKCYSMEDLMKEYKEEN